MSDKINPKDYADVRELQNEHLFRKLSGYWDERRGMSDEIKPALTPRLKRDPTSYDVYVVMEGAYDSYDVSAVFKDLDAAMAWAGRDGADCPEVQGWMLGPDGENESIWWR